MIHRGRDSVAIPDNNTLVLRVEEKRKRDVKNLGYFVGMKVQKWNGWNESDDGRNDEAAWCCQIVDQAEDLDMLACKADLFFCLPQRGVHERQITGVAGTTRE